MAMSNSLGVDADIGKTMALNLTGLVGDIASFYNITTEQANTAISAIYTGETESIKKLGIILTEANLNAYAVSQGLKKTYNQMTQAEKVMLRYNYVMMASANIQGDFARTSGNWANQVRILKEQFSQLLSILGRGLIAVLNPVVKVMNNLLASLIAVANAMAKAFGGKGIESASGKVSSSVGDIADGAGDIGSGFDDANDSAKALAKTVAGFDELNVLNSPKGAGGSGDVGLGGDITGSGEVVEGPEMENPAGKLSDYLQQCKDIIDKWVSTIPKLEINFDKDKAIDDLKNIGLNILNTIMGWGTFVVSIGIQVANDLDIGALANSFLNLIESATGLASAITDSVVPALQTFYKSSGLQDIVKWIGEKFKDGMDGLAIKLDEWAQWFKDNKEQINTFADNLGKAVKPVAELVIQIGDVAWSVFAGVLSTINDLLKDICESLINMDVEKLRSLMLTLAGLGGAFGLANAGAKLFGVSLLEIVTHPGTAISAFITLLTDVWLPALGTKLSSLAGIITGPFNALKGVIAGLGATFMTGFEAVTASSGIVLQNGTILQKFVTLLSAGLKGLWAVIKAHPIAMIITAVVACITAVAKLYQNSEEFRNFVNDLWENTIKPVFKGLAEAVKELWEKHLKPLWENQLKPLFNSLGTAFKGMWNTISEVIGWVVGLLGGTFLSTFVNVFGSILTTVTDIIGSVADILGGLIDFLTGVFSGDWSKAWEGIKKVFKGIWDSLVNVVKAPINLIIGLINGLVGGIVQGVNAIIKNINKLSWKVPDWVPMIGGSYFGFNLKTLTAPNIPYLAKGGIITEPTVAMMGEYAGAYQNPEIVAPQNLLQQVIENSNNNVVDALIQQTRQLLSALENIDLDVSIGDEQIAKSAQRGNLAYKRRTGKPLFA